MKNTMKLLLGLPILLAFLVVGCSLDTPDQPTDLVGPSGAEAFANYAAMGNSLTAGFQDGGVCINGQLFSYPRMIAQQMGLDASVGSSDFTQPYIALPGIGSTASSDPAIVNGVLHFDGASISVLGTHAMSDVLDPTSALNPLLLKTLPVPYDNHGVPGATLHDVMNAHDAYTSSPIGNSYFNFINRSSLFGNTSVPASAGPPATPGWETSSMFWQTVAAGPALTTLWIGNNDILGGAMGGNPVVGGNITDATTFQAEYTALLGTLGGALVQRTGYSTTIVVANIPSISTIPYFIPKTTFQSALPEELGGDWPWGYVDGNDDAGMLLTFPVLSWIADEDNIGSPIPSNYTLTTAEVGIVETQVATFNGIIAGVSAGVNDAGYAKVGVVDANALMVEISSGTHAAGPYAATHFMFLLGAGMTVEQAAGATLFSLDGVHPNSRGYGVIANAFIDKINELQETSVPQVNWAALTWDPTYGAAADKSFTGMPQLGHEAAQAMGAIFR
jgi:hypothetical protein